MTAADVVNAITLAGMVLAWLAFLGLLYCIPDIWRWAQRRLRGER